MSGEFIRRFSDYFIPHFNDFLQIFVPGLVLPPRRYSLKLGEEKISDGIITMIETLLILAEHYKQHHDETKVTRERFIELLSKKE